MAICEIAKRTFERAIAEVNGRGKRKVVRRIERAEHLI